MGNQYWKVQKMPRRRRAKVSSGHDDHSTALEGETSAEDIYEVESILGKRRRGGKTEYLIRWKGYSDTDNTWEPSQNVGRELIDAYESIGKVESPIQKKAITKPVRKSTAALSSTKRGKKPAETNKGVSQADFPDGRKPGSFEDHDVPAKISEFKQVKGPSGEGNVTNMFFKVEWRSRKDGTKPAGTYFSNEILRKRCPQLLLDYYEERIHISTAK
eukprot:TRINITY_DN1582_c0_g1_i1.p1 TRINITY_DN1582_c0_g1~~TRINITY_DN1582_c0_g1_i1.p1  ORF type:complete len:249 (+),score=49.06 TRINITY_DN1582_c0_g1_i1:100-747(+)